MPYTCPNKDPNFPATLTGVTDKLTTDKAFAVFFSEKLQEAISGEHDAIDCIDSYLKPDWGELLALGIPPDKQPPYRHCTDSGLLVVAHAKAVAAAAGKKS
jgi:hypothetical protein